MKAAFGLRLAFFALGAFALALGFALDFALAFAFAGAFFFAFLVAMFNGFRLYVHKSTKEILSSIGDG